VSNVDLHSTNLGDHGGQHGQESEEGKEEDSQEEKEVTVRRKPYGLRIASEVRYTFATRTGGSFRLQNIRTTVRPDRYANGCCITVRESFRKVLADAVKFWEPLVTQLGLKID
jgi:hypothetical protein